ncbi:MAG: O-methyltransferase [Acidimicrobiales bacterium]
MREPIYRYRLTDYDTSILPTPFLAFLEESVQGPDDWIPRTGRSLGHPGWGLVYHVTLARLNPDRHNVVVETGTNLGSTAMVIAKAIRDSGRSGIVRTIEIDPETMALAQERMALAGLDDYVEFNLGNSVEELEAVIGDEQDLPLVFLDGNHWHDHVVREFELVHPHLAHDAVVVFDNTYLIAENDEDPRVNGALRTIVDRFGGNLINLPFCSWYTPGVALWQQSAFLDMTVPPAGSFIPET